MSNIVEVVEKEIMLPYLVSSFDMNVIILQLNEKAVVITNTFDINKNNLYEKQFIIEGEEYANWGTDDNYLKNLIAGKLGLEIKPKLNLIESSNQNIELYFSELYGR